MTGNQMRGVTGDLFETWTPQPKPIAFDSWLNDPRHHEFAVTYEFAVRRLGALATKAFRGLEAEQVYLVWKTVETARAAAWRRREAGGFRR